MPLSSWLTVAALSSVLASDVVFWVLPLAANVAPAVVAVRMIWPSSEPALAVTVVLIVASASRLVSKLSRMSAILSPVETVWETLSPPMLSV